jgi:hypothetical protein
MVRVPGVDYTALDALVEQERGATRKQDLVATREQENGYKRSSLVPLVKQNKKTRGVSCSPSSVVKDAARPELDELVDLQRRGELKPANIPLHLPANLSADALAVAEDMRLLWGLFAAVGEHRPMPYSVRFSARRLGWTDHVRAHRAIRELQTAGVIRCVVSLKPRGGMPATKCYKPCPAG